MFPGRGSSLHAPRPHELRSPGWGRAGVWVPSATALGGLLAVFQQSVVFHAVDFCYTSRWPTRLKELGDQPMSLSNHVLN